MTAQQVADFVAALRAVGCTSFEGPVSLFDTSRHEILRLTILPAAASALPVGDAPPEDMRTERERLMDAGFPPR